MRRMPRRVRIIVTGAVPVPVVEPDPAKRAQSTGILLLLAKEHAEWICALALGHERPHTGPGLGDRLIRTLVGLDVVCPATVS
ncbi:hypothetical protein EXIGLDRAFT_729139 [Exidia glandulosa HHB12029]|uniref:Uncharacterized protein n=1 Tax=Exidia glandulosa HHB12029 TaxID=1314781 RepID=A0A165CQ63_EXIGL|nr:hypothetical protein EXIGLDRAFT_729139 [Exidia glandulosa HHB12029]